MSEPDRERSARQAAIRTIGRGERPVYRVLLARDGRWEVLGCPWLDIDANDRRSAVEATRAAVGEGLGAAPDAFNVVSG